MDAALATISVDDIWTAVTSIMGSPAVALLFVFAIAVYIVFKLLRKVKGAAR
jgi:hypothetical protein